MKCFSLIITIIICGCGFTSQTALAQETNSSLKLANCVLKLASLPELPAGTKIAKLEESEDENQLSYILSFAGVYGEPKEWWAKTPDWVGGEEADWESCEAKGDFADDAVSLELVNGHLIVEEKNRRITVLVGSMDGDNKNLAAERRCVLETKEISRGARSK